MNIRVSWGPGATSNSNACLPNHDPLADFLISARPG